METPVHEIGHSWMNWPHSYADIAAPRQGAGEIEPPNLHGNGLDFRSGLLLYPMPV